VMIRRENLFRSVDGIIIDKRPSSIQDGICRG
jgi:hypothetical protein